MDFLVFGSIVKLFERRRSDTFIYNIYFFPICRPLGSAARGGGTTLYAPEYNYNTNNIQKRLYLITLINIL
jgi:hypothetical protein